MKPYVPMLLATLLAATTPALAQMAARPTMTKVSGTISAVSAGEVELAITGGGTLAVHADGKTRIALSSPVALGEIKPGSFIGAGAMADGKGGNTAVEITVFPEAARGLGEGFRKWDQGPNSTMTNGTVSEVVGTDNRTLTVTYKGGQQRVTIPTGTPITTFSLADSSALVPGAHVVVRGSKGADGSVEASFITVGKDGFVPPG